MKKNEIARQTVSVSEDFTYKINREHITPETLQSAFEEFITRNPFFTREQLYMSISSSRGYYDEIDTEITICGTRTETEEEYGHRMQLIKEREDRDKENARKSREKAKAKRNAQDLVEYERLKKKFEGK